MNWKPASKKTIWAASALGLALAAAGAALVLRSRQAGEWQEPRVGPIVEAVYGVGTVSAWNSFTLKVSIPMVVKKLYVVEGQQVEKGQALLQFSDGPAYRAPFAGTVTAVNYKLGETVTPQMTVLSLSDLKRSFMQVSLEQSGALRVRKGQQALIHFEDIHMGSLSGTVESIYPQADQFLVRISVPEFPEGVLQGMVADVAIQVARRDRVPQIPVSALKGQECSVLRAGKVLKLRLKVGASDGKSAEVLDGQLEAGDKVLVPRPEGG